MFACVVAGPALVMTAASAPTPFYVGLTETLGLSPLQVAELFSTYVGPLLLTLLFAGSLSDHLGRRPVLCGGFLALAGSTVMLWQADAFGVLLGARAVQGIATGGLIAAVSATVFDFEPAGRRGLAGAANSASVMVGLALGAAGAGALVDHVAEAWSVVFGGLTVVYVASAALVWLLPETSTREPGAVRSLVPRFSVPRASRRPLARATPVLVAGWATGGVHLSLGGLIVRDTLQIRGALGQSAVLAVLATVGAGACWTTRRWQASRMTVVATLTLAVGTVVLMVACAASSLVGVVLGAAVGGVGFGIAFLAVVRTLEPTVDPARKGELLAAVYVISYLAYGVPAILAGALASSWGPPTALYAAGGVITVLAAGAAVVSLRSADRAAPPARRDHGRRHV